jgi:hypothetical protein
MPGLQADTGRTMGIPQFFTRYGAGAGGGAVDGRGGVYLLTEEGITVIDAAGQKTGTIRTDRYKGNLFFGEKLFGDTDGHVYYFVYEDFGFQWKGFRVEHSEGGSLLEAEGLSGSSRMHSCSVNRGKVAYSLADSFYEYPGDRQCTKPAAVGEQQYAVQLHTGFRHY